MFKFLKKKKQLGSNEETSMGKIFCLKDKVLHAWQFKVQIKEGDMIQSYWRISDSLDSKGRIAPLSYNIYRDTKGFYLSIGDIKEIRINEGDWVVYDGEDFTKVYGMTNEELAARYFEVIKK